MTDEQRLLDRQFERFSDALTLFVSDRRPWWRRLLARREPSVAALAAIRQVLKCNHLESMAFAKDNPK